MMIPLRERNRRNAMRLTQRTALDLFEERGFDDITIGELADEVGMAASTIYRHFGTKEGIILWDEHDADLGKALVEALATLPPWPAMRQASIEVLAHRYEQDIDFQLRRVRYIFTTEAMHSAAIEADYLAARGARCGLRGRIARAGPRRRRGPGRGVASRDRRSPGSVAGQWRCREARRGGGGSVRPGRASGGHRSAEVNRST